MSSKKSNKWDSHVSWIDMTISGNELRGCVNKCLVERCRNTSQWPGNNLKETRLMVSLAKSWSVLLGFVWIDLVLRLVMVNPGWERKSRTFLSWACLSNTTLPLRGNYESSCFPGPDEISPKTIPLSKLLFHVHQVIFWLFYFPGTSLSEKMVLWIWVTGIQEHIHYCNVL